MCDSIFSHPSEAVTARHELWFGRLCRARAAHTWACSIINTLCSLIDHTSHLYSNLGTATAQYCLLPLIGLIPPVLLIWIPMLWVYDHYKYINPYSARIDFRRQNLTTKVDPRAARVKASFHIPKNRYNFPTSKGFKTKISMQLVHQ